MQLGSLSTHSRSDEAEWWIQVRIQCLSGDRKGEGDVCLQWMDSIAVRFCLPLVQRFQYGMVRIISRAASAQGGLWGSALAAKTINSDVCSCSQSCREITARESSELGEGWRSRERSGGSGGGGREDKGWMNNAFTKGRKRHAAGRGNLQRGEIDLEKGCPLTLRSAPEISVYLSQSLSSLFSLLSWLLQLGREWDLGRVAGG